MEVRIRYSKSQLEGAINFIAEHNPSFLGRHSYIRASIHRHIAEMAAKFPHMTGIGTMGYYIQQEMVEEEGLDEEENSMRLEFSVDPGLGVEGAYTDEDTVERTFNVTPEPMDPIL